MWHKGIILSEVQVYKMKIHGLKLHLSSDVMHFSTRLKLIKCRCCPHIETSQLICCANHELKFRIEC